MASEPKKPELVQGTLDMLILRTLGHGARHGYAIARHIKQTSAGILKVEEGSLYPALHRMERRGWIESEWGLSEANRRAKYYRLTETGRARLVEETRTWNRLVDAIRSVLTSEPAEA